MADLHDVEASLVARGRYKGTHLVAVQASADTPADTPDALDLTVTAALQFESPAARGWGYARV